MCFLFIETSTLWPKKNCERCVKVLKKEKRTPKIEGILSSLSTFLLSAALLAAVFPFAPLTASATDEFIEDYYI